MFEEIPGKLISGAIWGLGAGLVLNVVNKRSAPANPTDGQTQQGPAARPVAKALMRAYVVAERKVRDATAEARENLSDIYAEVQAERREVDQGQRSRPVNIDIDQDEPQEQPAAAAGHGRRSHRSTADSEA